MGNLAAATATLVLVTLILAPFFFQFGKNPCPKCKSRLTYFVQAYTGLDVSNPAYEHFCGSLHCLRCKATTVGDTKSPKS